MTYTDAFNLTIIVIGGLLIFAILAAVATDNPRAFLYAGAFVAFFAGFFALCALVAVPIWLLT